MTDEIKEKAVAKEIKILSKIRNLDKKTAAACIDINVAEFASEKRWSEIRQDHLFSHYCFIRLSKKPKLSSFNHEEHEGHKEGF